MPQSALEFFGAFSHFSVILRPVVTGGRNRSTRRNPSPNPKSLATFSHVPDGIRTQAVVRDSKQSVATPRTTQPSGRDLSRPWNLHMGKRQRAVNHYSLQYRYSIPASVDRYLAVQHPWISCQNKTSTSMTHVACESKYVQL